MDRSLNLEGYHTDASLARSTSLSISASSLENSRSDPEETSEDNSDQDHTSREKKIKNKRVELIPPKEKLEKCEKRYLVHLENGENEKAMQELLKFPPLVRLVYGDQSWRYAEASWKVARGYLDLKHLPKQSVKHAEIAKSLILQGCHVEDLEKPQYIRCVSEVYLCLGRALLLLGNKLKEAENALQKSWHVISSKKKLGQHIQLPSASVQRDSLNLKVDIKMAFADLYILTKNVDQAKSCLNYVIKHVSESSTTNEDPKLISVYNKLAKAEKSKKKSEINFESVVEYRLRAHEISSAVHPLNSTQVADTAYSLGLAYTNVDSETTQITAETYFTEAIKSYESNFGSNDSKTIKAKDALYKVWTRTDRGKEAVKQLKNSVSIKRDVFGSCSSQVADTYKLIGGIYLSQGDIISAHKFLGKCLEVEQLLYGVNHVKTKSTKATLEQIGQNPALIASKPKEKKLRERPKFLTTIKSKS